MRLLIAAVLDEDSNCIDVGAHLGSVLKRMQRCAPRGRHIAYEPLPSLHAQLLTEFPAADVRLKALSNRTGVSSFVHCATNPGYSGFRELAYPSEVERLEHLSVEVERLDDALPDGYVPSLIKVDVEGAELEVFEGGLETLARFRPVVLFEHGEGSAPYYGTTPAQVHDLLTYVGLRVYGIDGRGPYTSAAFEDAFTKPIWNFFARP